MSLIQCKECHKVISSKSEECINCGYKKTPFIEKFRNGVYYIKIAFIFLILISIITFVNKMDSKKGREDIAKQMNKSLDNEIDLMKNIITQRLK